jgi:hypothetical protein
MKISNAFPSKYLKAADLNDRPALMTMSRVEIEDIGADEKKPVLYFSKQQKGLVLNRTNSKVISTIYGDDTDNWEGKLIVLFPAMVEFKGDTVEAIRVRKPKPQAAAPAAATKVVHTEIDPPPHDGMDDEIPF